MPTEYETPRTDAEAIREYGADQNKIRACFVRKLERELNYAMKANSILRAALYDIHEYDTDGDECSVCGMMAEKALTESALDENGRLAEPSNIEVDRRIAV